MGPSDTFDPGPTSARSRRGRRPGGPAGPTRAAGGWHGTAGRAVGAAVVRSVRDRPGKVVLEPGGIGPGRTLAAGPASGDGEASQWEGRFSPREALWRTAIGGTPRIDGRSRDDGRMRTGDGSGRDRRWQCQAGHEKRTASTSYPQPEIRPRDESWLVRSPSPMWSNNRTCCIEISELPEWDLVFDRDGFYHPPIDDRMRAHSIAVEPPWNRGWFVACRSIPPGRPIPLSSPDRLQGRVGQSGRILVRKAACGCDK